MEKLTNQELARIFAAYYGCYITIYGTEYEINGHLLSKNFGYNLAACKLILTPLSEIAEEHIIEVAKILTTDTDTAEYFLSILLEGNDAILSEYAGYEVREVIDFLRSRSYDCGYGNIMSLIDSKIAISSTKNEGE